MNKLLFHKCCTLYVNAIPPAKYFHFMTTSQSSSHFLRKQEWSQLNYLSQNYPLFVSRSSENNTSKSCLVNLPCHNHNFHNIFLSRGARNPKSFHTFAYTELCHRGNKRLLLYDHMEILYFRILYSHRKAKSTASNLETLPKTFFQQEE